MEDTGWKCWYVALGQIGTKKGECYSMEMEGTSWKCWKHLVLLEEMYPFALSEKASIWKFSSEICLSSDYFFAEKTAYFPSQIVIYLWHTFTMKADFLHKNKKPEIVYFHMTLFLCCGVCGQSLQLCLFETLWTVTCQAPVSTEFFRQEYWWSGLSFSPPGDLPNSGMKLMSPGWQADSLPLSHQGSPPLLLITLNKLRK